MAKGVDWAIPSKGRASTRPHAAFEFPVLW